MHNDKLVIALKVDGQVLRETGDTVALPFGREYSIFIKNLNSVRTQVSVSVDGQDALGGTKMILQPNSSIDLERFIKNGNFQSGNRFKFIERTAAVEAHRGVGAEDGLVRVEQWREIALYQEAQVSRVEHHYHHQPSWSVRLWPNGSPMIYGMTSGNSTGIGGQSVASASYEVERGAAAKSASNILRGQGFNTASANTAGITAAGSQSNQAFQSVFGFPLESQSAVAVLKLIGHKGKLRVAKPVTVKAKPTCVSCGLKNAPKNTFCSGCGTALVLL